MDEGIEALQDKFDVTVPEYTVAAIQENGEYIHRWYLGKDTGEVDEKAAAEFLDKYLQENNKNYKVARSKALKDVELRVVHSDTFYAYSEKQKKKGGQVKFPRVMKEEDFREWEDFASEKPEVT